MTSVAAAPAVPDAVLHVFFGCTRADVPHHIVLTPIPAFYRACVAGAEDVVEHRGWWRLVTARRGALRYAVVLHFEGTRVVDPVRALAGARSRFAFLGLVGGVDPGTDVGGLVEITSAGRGGCPVAAPPAAVGRQLADVPAVRALTADGLLDDLDRVRTDASDCAAAVVDLESYFYFQAVRATRAVDAVAFGLVTDRPGRLPFWEVAMTESDLAAAGALMATAVGARWTLDLHAAPTGGRHG